MDKISPIYQEVGKMMATALRGREDFRMEMILLAFEGRDMLSCECGRKYQKRGWSYKHFARMGHAPPQTQISVGVLGDSATAGKRASEHARE